MEETGLFEVMRTQRGVIRYAPDPVPRAAIEKIIEAATMAPSGGNSQPWEFVVVTDRDLVEKVGRIYEEVWMGRMGAGTSPGETAVYKSARYMANHMHEAPALVLICVDHGRGNFPYTPGQPFQRGAYASSIWPAVQNFMLAARALGLGTRLTTTHVHREEEIKDLLGIPESVETVVLTPLGYPKGTFGPLDRRPAAELTSYNRWRNRG